jgi:ankyrin repeat protein
MYAVAEMLIEAGANLEAVGELGNRPLHLAASANRQGLCIRINLVVPLATPHPAKARFQGENGHFRAQAAG